MVGMVAWVSRERTPGLFSIAGGIICNLEKVFQLCLSQCVCISEETLHVCEKHSVKIGRRVTLMMAITYR